MTRFRPFRQKKNYLPAVIIVALVIIFSLSAYRGLFGGRELLINAIYPFQAVTAYLWRSVVGFPSALVNLKDLAVENAELKKKLGELKPQLAAWDELSAENRQLHQALGFQQSQRFGCRLLASQVVGRSASAWYSMVEIDKGSRSGVTLNTPVVVESGLVGQVVEVSDHSAKVLLITDPESGVAGVVSRSRDQGLVAGYSPTTLLMKYIATSGDVQVGDKVITAAASGLFPSGWPIGTVKKATKKEHDLFYQIELTPAATLSSLEIVYLVL